MADNKMNENEELYEAPVYTLTDEETGESQDFELLAEGELDGKTYFALAEVGVDTDEYVILRVTEDDEGLTLESIDDDDEFEAVEDYFNDLFMDEIDYDN